LCYVTAAQPETLADPVRIGFQLATRLKIGIGNVNRASFSIPTPMAI
jgi:hypothetical protein